MDFAYTISGFAVGFIVGLTGVGGGSLMTLILVLLFAIKPAIAVGTDLSTPRSQNAAGSACIMGRERLIGASCRP